MNRFIAPVEENHTTPHPVQDFDREVYAAAPAQTDDASQSATSWDDDEDLWDNVPI